MTCSGGKTSESERDAGLGVSPPDHSRQCNSKDQGQAVSDTALRKGIGMIRRSPRSGEVAMYYDQVSAIYDRKDEEPMWRITAAITWPWILQSLPARGSRVLDAGGGTGKWAIPLAQEGYSVTIVDVSQGMLDQATRKVKQLALNSLVECRRADFTEIPYPDESFEVVLCDGDALGLTPRPQKALKEFRRVLVRGGTLLLGVSNALNLLIVKSRGKESMAAVSDFLDSFLHREPPANDIGNQEEVTNRFPRCGPNFRTFTPFQMKEMIRNAGLSLVSIFPRVVLVDFLDYKVLEEAGHDQSMFDELVRLERKAMRVRGSEALGGHLLITARKPYCDQSQAWACDGTGRPSPLTDWGRSIPR